MLIKENIEITIADILQEYLDDSQLSQSQLARLIGVNTSRVNEIMRNRRKITPDTDLRLCKFFNKTDGFFIRIQDNLEIKKTKTIIQEDLNNIVPYTKSA